ncbi:hypothetical protein SRHO_G00229590 [Serrasalmus rhombeus]
MIVGSRTLAGRCHLLATETPVPAAAPQPREPRPLPKSPTSPGNTRPNLVHLRPPVAWQPRTLLVWNSEGLFSPWLSTTQGKRSGGQFLSTSDQARRHPPRMAPLTPMAICLLATPTACSPGGIRKSTCSHGFGTALARSAWDENNKATKISRFTEPSFLLWPSAPLSLRYEGQPNDLRPLASPPAKIHKSINPCALNLAITPDCLDNGVRSLCPSLPQEAAAHFPPPTLQLSTFRTFNKFDTIPPSPSLSRTSEDTFLLTPSDLTVCCSI